MKTSFLRSILLSFFFLSSCLNKAAVDKPIIENLEPKTFKALLEKYQNAILIDVRTLEETSTGHMKDATIINFYDKDFDKRLNLLRKEVPIFVYCKSGGRSAAAAEQMQELGFSKIYNLLGGINSWKDKGFQIVEDLELRDRDLPPLSLIDFDKLLDSNLPVLVEFSTGWCIPCRKMMPIIDSLKETQKDHTVIIRVDAELSQEVTSHYFITGVPTFILYENKQEIWRHTGLISREELLIQLGPPR